MPIKTRPIPDKETLHSLLTYSKETGLMHWVPRDRALFSDDRQWKTWNSRFASKLAFTMLGANGYLYGSIWDDRFLLHRVAFKMVEGRDPLLIDHIDGDRANNRWANIREVTQSQNMRNAARPRNNTSGHVGVYWVKTKSRWAAAIKVNKQPRTLGYFKEKVDAIAARKAAELRLGFHENHGRSPDV